jgi:hypothetical protein
MPRSLEELENAINEVWNSTSNETIAKLLLEVLGGPTKY